MATFIAAMDHCTARMTNDKYMLAERLEIVLKINDGSTPQILQTSSLVAADLLTADDKDDDGIPLLKPISCSRDGQAPLIIRLPSLQGEAFKIAELLSAAHQEGHAWGDMAVICRDWATMDICQRRNR